MKRQQSKGWMVYLGVVLVVASLANGFFEVHKAGSAGVEEDVIAEDVEGFAPYMLPVIDTPTPFLPSPDGSSVLPTVQYATLQPKDATRAANRTQVDEEAELETPSTYTPDRIVIPSIKLDAPVVPVELRLIKVEGIIYQQWKAPDEFAAGWHPTTAKLGEPGNTVMNGHHNVHGKVFGDLIDVEVGDQIIVYSENKRFYYEITNKMILPELDQPLDVRLENARWLQPSDDERLTLVTCWPPEGNLERLIVVAKPSN